MIQTVDGAAIEITNMLQRMRELAVQAASGTMSSTDVTALDTEFLQLRAQIEDIASDTTWNGVAVMSGGAAVGDYGKFTFQVGANASQTIDVNFGDWNLAAAGTATAYVASTSANDSLGRDISAYNVNDASIITNLSSTIDDVNTARATYGAVINRLEYAADNLSNVSQNTSASRSRVLDADYAAETTELARTQIIQQAATAMLSQANQQAQSVLALLK
jgi:flagellin